MSTRRRIDLISIAFAAISASYVTTVTAQQPFPSRPVTLIITMEAGGSVDAFGRALGRIVSERIGVNVLVENRPGGNNVIAASACARARPDGHTLCALPRDSISILPFEQAALPYDPLKDLAPVTNLAWFQSVIAASVTLPVTSFQELVDYSRRNPNKVNYTGFGSNPSMMEWIKKQTGADLTYVPFKGGASASQAFLSGDVQVMFQSIGSPGIMPMLKSGKMRALVAPGDRRTPLLPDVPTHLEVGLPNFNIRSWLGAFAPAGSPKDAIAKLSAEFAAVVRIPEFRDKSMIPFGWDPIGNSPEEFARFIVSDRREGEELVKISGKRSD
jgi:tripartite-type tricarboxylate transporter receptor subunit TctC